MTVQIFTSVVNRPDFVDLQNKLFQKFLKGDYQFHIIDDSIDSDISSQFQSICLKNNFSYYKKPERKNEHSASFVQKLIQHIFSAAATFVAVVVLLFQLFCWCCFCGSLNYFL